MNKFLPVTGGHSLRLDEFTLMQDAYLEGFKALVYKFAPTGNLIVDGVVVDTSGANVVYTSGYIAIAGEIYKVESGTFPKSADPGDILYFLPTETVISPSSPVTYEDTTDHDVHLKRVAVLKYKAVEDTTGAAYSDMSYASGLLEGSFIPWMPPSGKAVTDYFDATGKGINSATGWAICNGLNNTVDLRGMYLPMATNVPFSGGVNALRTILDGTTTNVGVDTGRNKVTLTEAELPAHSFSVTGTTDSAGTHTHMINQTTNAGQGSASGSGIHLEVDPDDKYWRSSLVAPSGAHTHNVTGSTNVVGSSTAHENRPASYPVYYIMKVK